MTLLIEIFIDIVDYRVHEKFNLPFDRNGRIAWTTLTLI